MATVYVSNTATNGYGVGDNSYTYAQMQNKATPALTIAGVWSKLSAGDTIVVNDGIYTEGTALAMGNSKSNVTLNAQNDYMVTIKSTGNVYVAIHYPSATGLTIGKVIFDAEAGKASCVFGDTASANVVTINGTKFINFTMSAMNYSKITNLTMSGDWVAESVYVNGANPYPFRFTSTGAGTISIQDGSVDVTCTANSTNTLSVFTCDTTATDVNIKIKNVTARYGSLNPAMTLQLHSLLGYATYEIENNDIEVTTLQNASGGMFGIVIHNSSLAIANKCWIRNNTINAGNTSPATNATGYCIAIGEDADSSANKNRINGILIEGNICSNANHMMLLAWVTGATVRRNYCTNGVIGLIGKYTTSCLFSGNIIKNITTGGALRMKASTGDIFTNNTVILTSATGVGMMATVSSITASSGGTFKNNIIYMYGAAGQCIEVSNDGSSATFTKNDYYSDSGFAAVAFRYNADTYATVALWKAANESTALNVLPQFKSFPNNLRVLAKDTNLYHAGTYAGNIARDYLGRRFYVTPTIGAYEVGSGDIPASRTARS